MWAVGEAYDKYVGRWSREVAGDFLRWLDVPAGRRWLDVGCGTGALTATVLALADPAEVVGVDPSPGFLETARTRITDPRVDFRSGDARDLPVPTGQFDAVVSGLCLNFIPDPARAVTEWSRAAAPGAVVAAYVWDYSEGMAMMRYFWDAAADLVPELPEDEGPRYATVCRPDALRALWTDAGLGSITAHAIDVPTVFSDFDDFWSPFLGGQGVAPAYLMSLPEPHRAALRERLRTTLPARSDGSIPLTARAWAVSGRIGG
jgi:SAM-dependent methyltransferase